MMGDTSGKMITDKGEGFFICLLCGHSFNSKKGYNIHKGIKHHEISGTLFTEIH